MSSSFVYEMSESSKKKNAQHDSPEAKVIHSDSLFHLTSSSKHKHIHFTIIYDEEKHHNHHIWEAQTSKCWFLLLEN